MSIRTLVDQFLQEQDWKYSFDKESSAFHFGFSGVTGNFHCIIDVDELEAWVVVLSVCGMKAPEEKRMGMAELVTRLNFYLKVGHLEMDFTDGEVRLKTSIRIPPNDATTGIIRHLILTNILTMDRALPILMELVFGDKSPEELCNKFLAA